jgi:hypothetical protein
MYLHFWAGCFSTATLLIITLRGVSTNKILYVLSPCKPTKNLAALLLLD